MSKPDPGEEAAVSRRDSRGLGENSSRKPALRVSGCRSPGPPAHTAQTLLPTTQQLMKYFFRGGGIRPRAGLADHGGAQWGRRNTSFKATEALWRKPWREMKSSITVKRGPGRCPHSFSPQRPCREADGSLDLSHLFLLVPRNFASRPTSSPCLHPSRAGPGRTHRRRPRRRGSLLGAGSRVRPSCQTSPTSPSAEHPGQHGDDWGGVAERHLAWPASVLGPTADLRAGSQAPGPISGRQPSAFTSHSRSQDWNRGARGSPFQRAGDP